MTQQMQLGDRPTVAELLGDLLEPATALREADDVWSATAGSTIRISLPNTAPAFAAPPAGPSAEVCPARSIVDESPR